MRFLRRDKIDKTILVISDLHLGAGAVVSGKRNCLEDFSHDRELVEFLDYFQSGEYANRDVELVINGDFLDFLAVPYVRYFDDEIWSEKASIERLKLIISAHCEVFDALRKFVSQKKRKLVYILGNHDAELVLEGVRKFFVEQFPLENRDNVLLLSNDGHQYIPHEGIYVIHGHEYEVAHHFHSRKSIVLDEKGERYFLPPWGSYYITRVVNKFKEEKSYINAVKPIRKFLINSLIYDTLFTLRFMVATVYYFLMVRFIYFFMQHRSLRKLIDHVKRELTLYRDYEILTEEFFERHRNAKALIVGHTHEPLIRQRGDGSVLINTGSWTRLFHLDFGKMADGIRLTFAQIDVRTLEKRKPDCVLDTMDCEISLNVWKGANRLPYREY